MKWVTNSPVAAKALLKADKAFDKAMAEVKSLPLGKKVEAIRLAKAMREMAYNKVLHPDWPIIELNEESKKSLASALKGNP
jgi:hypothetical protein